MTKNAIKAHESIFKVGDKAHLVFEVPMAEDSFWTQGVKYDAVILEHYPGRSTHVLSTNDRGESETVVVAHSGWDSGYEYLTLLISDEELEIRRKEWIQTQIEKENSRFEEEKKKHKERLALIKKSKIEL